MPPKRFKHRLDEQDAELMRAHERQNLEMLAAPPSQRPARREAVAIARIELGGGPQPRVGRDEDTALEYAERMSWDKLEGAVVDPELRAWEAITVFDDGQRHWLADGFHRVEAARRAGLERFQADVHSGTQRDAVAYSLGANATHGKRRTNADKRRAVARALGDEGWLALSDREIARMCKVSQPFVSKVRRELEESGQVAQLDVRVAADGTTFEADVLRDQRLGVDRPAPTPAPAPPKKAAPPKERPGLVVLDPFEPASIERMGQGAAKLLVCGDLAKKAAWMAVRKQAERVIAEGGALAVPLPRGRKMIWGGPLMLDELITRGGFADQPCWCVTGAEGIVWLVWSRSAEAETPTHCADVEALYDAITPT